MKIYFKTKACVIDTEKSYRDTHALLLMQNNMLCFFELAWSKTCMRLEGTVEIGGIIKSAGNGNG